MWTGLSTPPASLREVRQVRMATRKKAMGTQQPFYRKPGVVGTMQALCHRLSLSRLSQKRKTQGGDWKERRDLCACSCPLFCLRAKVSDLNAASRLGYPCSTREP